MTFADEGEHLTPSTRRLLDHLSKQPIKEKISVMTRLIEGAPFREIIHIAGREGADLIVMGTHGRTGFRCCGKGGASLSVRFRPFDPCRPLQSEEWRSEVTRQGEEGECSEK